MEIKIDIPNKLLTAYLSAVELRNEQQEDPEDNKTSKEMLFKMLRDFTIDTLREEEIREGQRKGDEKVMEL